MKKKWISTLLIVAILITNSGIMYAADVVGESNTAEEARLETNTDKTTDGVEERMENPDVVYEVEIENSEQETDSVDIQTQEEQEEALAVSTYDAQDGNTNIYTDMTEKFNYTIVDGMAMITKYIGSESEVTIPETIDGVPVTEIDKTAFRGMNTVTSVVLSKGLKKIDEGAFANCSELVSVDLPGTLEEMGAHAFYNCDKLESIEIPKSLTKTNDAYIYEYAYGYVYGPFYGCDGLKKVTFENGTTTIANGLFANCPGLEEVTIPDTVIEVGADAFNNASGLKRVVFGENLTEIKSNAFGKCALLTNIEMKDKVTKIGEGAFAKCTELKKVKLSKTTKEMGAHAFYDCDKLESIEIPKSLTKTNDAYIYEYAYGYVYGPFYGCDGLKKVTFENGTTTIANGLFANCPGLEEVTIPDTVIEVGADAFNNASGLKQVVFGENLTEIKSNAFGKCALLTNIEMKDKVTKIGEGAFAKCTELKKVKLSKTTKEMGAHAFYDCDKLESIEIPKSLTKTNDAYIYEYAYGYVYGPFYGCDGLKKVTFENGTTTIANGLFANCPGLEEVTIPNTITDIGAKAFENCTQLSYLILTDNLTNCDNTAFQNCEKLTLLCNYGSLAHIFAIENNIPVKLISYAYSDFSILAIQEDCSYDVDCNALNVNGCLNVKVHYHIKEDVSAQATDKVLSCYVPQDAEIFEETIYINGRLSYDYSVENGKLIIPITDSKGDISYGFRPQSSEILSTAAVYEYQLNGENKKELVGFDNSSKSLLTIEADTMISTNEFTVQGIGEKSTDIDLYINDILQTTVTTSKTGKYQTQLSLANPVNNTVYTIKARKASDDGQAAMVNIQYNDAAPILKEFKLYYNNQRDTVIDLMNTDSKPYISFNPKVPFTFVTEFQNTESIENVYIVSTRNNERKIMEAEYDEKKEQFIASGYFDDNNHSYVPGNLTVECNYKKEEAKVGQEVDWQEMYQSLSEDMKKAEITVLEEGNEQSLRVDLSKVSEELEGVVLDYTVSVFEEETGESWSDWLGVFEDAMHLSSYVIPGINNERYYAAEHSDNLEWVLLLTKDITAAGNGAVKIGLKLQNPGDWTSLNEIADKVDIIAKAASVAYDIRKFYNDKNELISEIYQSPEISNKGEAVRRAEELFNDQKMYTLMAAVLPLAVKAIGIGGPAAIGFSAVLAMIGATSSFFWDARVNNIKSGTASLRWGIDPSGYVYEAVEENRVSGVKVTAYYKENLEDVEGSIWDALEYEQANPLYTDINGAYAWDVPEGYWQVKYEKEGYEIAYSDWLSVPPPQTDVNVSLVSKDKPTLESIIVYADHAKVVFSKYMVPDSVSSLKIVDQKGNNVAYTLEYDTTSVNAEGVNYAKEYILRFAKNTVLVPGSNCSLISDGTVKSYAQVAMKAEEVTSVVNKNIEIVVPEEVSVKAGDTLEIPVTIANTVEKMEFTANSEFDEIVSIDKVKANSIVVAGNMYGVAEVTICLPKTGITKIVKVTVGKATEAVEVKPIVILPQSVYTIKVGEKLTIIPEVYPDVTAKGSWSVKSDQDAISVQGNVFTAKKSGEIILRYALDGQKEVYAECKIIVLSDIVRGDINGDGDVDIVDLRGVLRAVCGKSKLTEQQEEIADVVEDGVIDIRDLRVLLRYVCGKITEL